MSGQADLKKKKIKNLRKPPILSWELLKFSKIVFSSFTFLMPHNVPSAIGEDLVKQLPPFPSQKSAPQLS